jgi:L-2,4-diaminobutyrate decarboxylase
MSIKDIYNAQNFKAEAEQLIELLVQELSSSGHREGKTIPYQKPLDMLSHWEKFQEKSGLGFIEICAETIKKSTRLHHPRFMGHQVVPPAPLAALAGFFSEFLNNGMAVYEMGMTFNILEKMVSDFMCRRIGFGSESGGLLTSGGTLGNLTALLTARAVMIEEDVWENGSNDKLAIMVSEQAHYCVDRAARIMGLGSEGIIKVPVDEKFKIKTELLEDHYQKAIDAGFKVFALIGSACSTSTGSFDDLSALATFASEKNLWFHVDAAHGGAAVFSEKYKSLLLGINYADSVVIDFHKMMLTPALATGVFYKKEMHKAHTFHQKAQYLWDDAEHDWYNSGKNTFECTKFGISFKIYVLWKVYGEQIFAENIDVLFDLAKAFAHQIKARNNFELALEPECNIVNFRFVKEGKDLSELNKKIRQELLEDGEFYIVSTILNGQFYLRTSLMNPLSTLDDTNALLEKIEKLAGGLN